MAKRYEEEAGTDTRRRQAELGKSHYVCCGEPKEQGHHLMCSRRPKDEAKPLDGQVALL